MEIALWALNNMSLRKLGQMRIKYNDYKFREVPGTIISEVSFLGTGGTITKFDTTGMDVDKIIDFLREHLCR